ncbi:Uncharacterised protein [Mycobacterium tuberculosis]|nr:Uncharacterised protein [Mycobacterium tuberculosis]COX44363.1 Uncharacterised protein [Mycobacterium tuberculosis]COZ24968.1 Uncharacterised protein [Mycobacterium tuberculosis]COZ65794.1 Uncharacterised protein [Mycobacterium tuberculosis]
MATDSPNSLSRSRNWSAAAASHTANRYITSNCGAGRWVAVSVGNARGEGS